MIRLGGSVRIAVIVLSGAVLAAVLPGCSNEPDPWSPSFPRVVVVGDSITNLSSGEIASRFKGRFRYVIAARNGKTISEQAPYLDYYLSDPAGGPEVVIVNLGTNDYLQGKEDAIEDLERLAASVAHVPCVVFYTVLSYPFTQVWGLAKLLNATIHELARSHVNFHVTAWDAVVARNIGIVSGDALHPSERGQDRLADLYLRDVEETCADATRRAATTSREQPGSDDSSSLARSAWLAAEPS